MTQSTRGYVYAATGEPYRILARRSARALRRVVGNDAQIDLFTDAPLDDPVFNRVVPLDHVSVRPKIEALTRSRFDLTLYFDCDTICLAPIDDVFDIMAEFDLAMCAEQRRNDRRNREHRPGQAVPTAFPQLNSGVIGLRRSDATVQLLTDWHRLVHSGTERFDQASFRHLVFVSPARLHTLPAEYNVMFPGPFLGGAKGLTAPRLLHLPTLHDRPPGDPHQPLQAHEALSPQVCRRYSDLLAEDLTLSRYVDPVADGSGAAASHRSWRLFRRLRRMARNWLRRPIR